MADIVINMMLCYYLADNDQVFSLRITEYAKQLLAHPEKTSAYDTVAKHLLVNSVSHKRQVMQIVINGLERTA